MAYCIPTDLPKLAPSWQPWPIEARIRAAMARADVQVWASLAAVTISMVEQPGDVPVGNCCGIMSQGDEEPWGWHSGWKVKPIGYALLNEWQGIKGAPFLAFAKVEDSLNFVIDRCQKRGINSGRIYAAAWVGLTREDNPSHFDGVAAAYEVRHDAVIAALWRMAAEEA